eukprot:g6909.t1
MRSTRQKVKLLERNLIDSVQVHAIGGSGGDGALSYRKHASAKLFGPGIPWGGCGGRGGDVVLQVAQSANLRNIVSPKLRADNGGMGRRRNGSGLNGENLVVRVPPGVLVSEIFEAAAAGGSQASRAHDGGEPALVNAGAAGGAFFPSGGNSSSSPSPPAAVPAAEELSIACTTTAAAPCAAPTPATARRLVKIADLTALDETFVLACGGLGGGGNTMEDPHDAGKGSAGEDRKFLLELHSIADVGLVGFPNAGKSSFLRAVSRATPKVAAYPFTTLAPFVGNVQFKDGFELSVADVPGLVEDAHLDRGLGHEFLQHLQRTKALLYVVDASLEGVDAVRQLEILRREIFFFSEEMAARPYAILANKCDLGGVALENVDRLFNEFCRGHEAGREVDVIRARSAGSTDSFRNRSQGAMLTRFRPKVFAISAKSGVGVGSVVAGMRRMLKECCADVPEWSSIQQASGS